MKRETRESLPRSAKKKSPAESSSPAKIPTSEEVRRCAHCASEKTPQWRAGPSGPKTLCNACGVRYKSGRLVPEYRPAASPTFVLTQHSNLHGKVMELRARVPTQSESDVCVDAAALEFEPESDGIAQPEKDAEAAGGSLT